MTYFQTVPLELEEAARLDGCNRLGILFRVVMPISVPGLIFPPNSTKSLLT